MTALPGPLGPNRWNIQVHLTGLKELKYVCINHGVQRFFFTLKSSWNVLALSASFEYLCYGSLSTANINVFNSSNAGMVFYTSESDVYRRHILTYKDGPCAERVNGCHINPFKPEFTIVIIINYKPRIATAIRVTWSRWKNKENC